MYERASPRTQDEFVALRRADWEALAELLARDRPLHKLPAEEIARFCALYRVVCADLVRAQGAAYSTELLGYLDNLAGRAHNLLYAAPPHRLAAVWELLARDLPRTLRRNLRFFAVSAALLYIPMLVCALATVAEPSFAAHVLSRELLDQMAQMYAEGFDGRGEGQDTAMAGFYVYNNIGIAFRCFATGALFGLGSLFFLVYNGISMGTVLGHVIASGYARNILTFICTHGTFELTAIVIAGGAGLQMGYALVDTGGRTRLGSLRAQARDLATLIIGAAVMLLIAAVIEAFWSPSSVPAPAKWAAAGVCALLLVLYFWRVGRDGGPR